MNTLITAAEVIAMSFPGSYGMDDSLVPDSLILSVEQKHVKPVLGGLYEVLQTDRCKQLLENYVKPVISAYVKTALLPALSALPGNMGLVSIKSPTLEPAGKDKIALVKRQARSEANALMLRMIEYVESRPVEFPEYESRHNVRNRLSVAGDVVL